MALDLNLVDALLALVILLSVVVGWYRGFLLGTLGLAVLIATVLLAFWGYPYVARELEAWDIIRGPLGLPIAFLGTFVILRILLGGVADLIVMLLPARAHTHPVNRFFGLAPGFVNGLLNAMVIAVLLLALPLSDRLTKHTRGSEIAARLAEPAHWLEARLTPIFEEAVSKTMSRVVVKPGSRESMPLAFTVQDPQPRPDLEAQMLQMLNKERTSRGLPALRADPELTEVARAHSRDMFARGYFSHVTPDGKDLADRIRKAKVSYTTAGENLALAPTLPLAHEGLMNSPGHRANILRPAFGRVGIGVLDGGKRGQMVTQNFRN